MTTDTRVSFSSLPSPKVRDILERIPSHLKQPHQFPSRLKPRKCPSRSLGFLLAPSVCSPHSNYKRGLNAGS